MSQLRLFLLAKHSRCGLKNVILLMICSLLLILHFFSEKIFHDLICFQFSSVKSTDIVDGYLVRNTKCHMPSENSFHPSIVKFVKKEQYEKCTNSLLLTAIIHNPNKTDTLILNVNETKHLNCCWTPILRTSPNKAKLQENFDSLITVGKCTGFKNSIILPKEVEIVMVSCINKKKKEIYKNIHSVLNVEKVANRWNNSKIGKKKDQQRKLSILLLGIDSVSRLSLIRNLPKTVNYLDNQGWLNMKGYNKIGENTFPNLMAILTGQKATESFEICNPKVPYGLDYCQIVWYNFRNAGYVTAFIEDESFYSTFNYNEKVGFVNPPTDFYLRPYILATEKWLKTHKRFGSYYCTGPEVVTERILNSAVDFSKRFLGYPNFGFFWTNSVSHGDLNGLSSMDSPFLASFKRLENEGVTNESMIIFLSDHGIRFGEFRNTHIGWYEERLPFLYIWLPKWFRKENPEVYQNLIVNQNRLTSPFDLYETLRDVLIRAGGSAEPSISCPKCESLFKPVSKERGCEDAGISSHWCTCSSLQEVDASEKSIVYGANAIVDYIDSLIKDYKSEDGKRLCAKLKLQKIHRIEKVVNPVNPVSKIYLYMIEVSPGGGKFEATIQYFGFGNYTILDKEVSRINTYGPSSQCLHYGKKMFCHCIN